MYNNQIRKLILETEQQLEYLKKDYEDLERVETEEYRKECLLDIRTLRRSVYTLTQKIKDLNWIKKDV